MEGERAERRGDTQSNRERWRTETERKHTEGNKIDGDRNAETEILRDKEKKLEGDSETETDREGQRDEQTLTQRHEGLPTSILSGPLH